MRYSCTEYCIKCCKNSDDMVSLDLSSASFETLLVAGCVLYSSTICLQAYQTRS
jgi:hypothetical protein